jgi:transposase
MAQALAVHRATVHAWLTCYRRQGLAGLKIHWAPGQPGRIPPALAPVIIDWVKQVLSCQHVAAVCAACLFPPEQHPNPFQ